MLEALVGVFLPIANKLPAGRKQNSIYEKTLFAFCLYSVMGVIPDELNVAAVKALGPDGDRVVSYVRSGGGSFDSNGYAQDTARNGFGFGDFAQSLQIFMSRFADASNGQEAADAFEEYFISASKSRSPSHNYSMAVSNAFPMVFDPLRFVRIVQSWEIDSFAAVDTLIRGLPNLAPAWTTVREDGTSYCGPDCFIWLMKILLITKRPDKSAEEAKVVYELVASEAPENSACFRDIAMRVLQMGDIILGPCLAASFGDYRTARSHAQVVLASFQNPLRILYANLDLGKVTGAHS